MSSSTTVKDAPTKKENLLTVKRFLGYQLRTIEKIELEALNADNNPAACARVVSLANELRLNCERALDWGKDNSHDLHELERRVSELEKATEPKAEKKPAKKG